MDPRFAFEQLIWSVVSGLTILVLLADGWKRLRRKIWRFFRIIRRQLSIYHSALVPTTEPKLLTPKIFDYTGYNNTIFPPEILFHIFSFCSTKDLLSLSLVCQNYRPEVQRCIFRVLSLRSLRQCIILSHLFSHTDSLFGKYVQTLDLSEFGKCGHSSGRYGRRLQRLLQFCPAIKRVVIKNTLQRVTPYGFGQINETISMAIFDALISTDVVGSVESMDSILPRLNYDISIYQEIFLDRRKSQKEVDINVGLFSNLRILRIHGDDPFPARLESARNLSKLLHIQDFKLDIYPLIFKSYHTLTSLTLSNYHFINLTEWIALNDVIRPCESLRYLRVEVTTRLDQNEVSLAIEELVKSMSQCSKYLEELSFQIPYVSYTCANTLISSLPHSLYILEILLENHDLDPLLSQFALRRRALSNLKFLNLFLTVGQSHQVKGQMKEYIQRCDLLDLKMQLFGLRLRCFGIDGWEVNHPDLLIMDMSSI